MSFKFDSQSDFAWISQHDPQPDVCCTCGMFTTNRITVKHVDFVERPVGESAGCASVFLTLGVHLFLGPLGWLISAMMRDKEDENATKTVKEKTKLRLSQCVLCFGTKPPEAVDSQQFPTSLMFLVHPRFKREFDSMKIKLRDAARDEST